MTPQEKAAAAGSAPSATKAPEPSPEEPKSLDSLLDSYSEAASIPETEEEMPLNERILLDLVGQNQVNVAVPIQWVHPDGDELRKAGLGFKHFIYAPNASPAYERRGTRPTNGSPIIEFVDPAPNQYSRSWLAFWATIDDLGRKRDFKKVNELLERACTPRKDSNGKEIPAPLSIFHSKNADLAQRVREGRVSTSRARRNAVPIADIPEDHPDLVEENDPSLP